MPVFGAHGITEKISLNQLALFNDDVTAVVINGHNADVDAAVETIWTKGGVYVYLTDAETLSIVSSDAKDDKDSGVGVRRLLIQGLNNSFEEISEQIDLEGQSPVTTVNQYLRVNKVIATQVGSEGDAAGTITATGSVSTGVTVFEIIPGENETQMAIFTVPTGKRFIPTFMQIGNGTNDKTEIRLRIRQDVKANTLSPFITTATIIQAQGVELAGLPGSVPAPAHSDIQWDGHGGTNDDVFISLAGVLIPS